MSITSENTSKPSITGALVKSYFSYYVNLSKRKAHGNMIIFKKKDKSHWYIKKINWLENEWHVIQCVQSWIKISQHKVTKQTNEADR